MKLFTTFLFILTFSCAQHEYPSIAKPDHLEDGIQTATLADVGMDDRLIQAMQDSITAGVYSNIHSVLILRHDKLVYGQYCPGMLKIGIQAYRRPLTYCPVGNSKKEGTLNSLFALGGISPLRGRRQI